MSLNNYYLVKDVPVLSVGSEVKVIIKENRQCLLMGATGNVTELTKDCP